MLEEDATPGAGGEDPPRARPQRLRWQLGVVYATMLVDLVAGSIVTPLLPYYAHDLGGEGREIGLLAAAYAVPNLVASIALGRLSDRVGRRPVVLVGLVGTVLSSVAMFFARSLVSMCAARVLAGIFGGTVPVVQAYLTDVSAPDERAARMGHFGAAIGLAFVVGPALGGLVSTFASFRYAVLVAAALALGNLVVAAVVFRESLAPADRAKAAGATHRQLWGAFWERPLLLLLVLTNFCTCFAFQVFGSTFSLLGLEHFGLTMLENGFMIAGYGLTFGVMQAVAVGPCSRRFGEKRIASVTAIALGSGLIVLPLSPHVAVLIVLLIVIAAGDGLLFSALSTLLSLHAASDMVGFVMGVSESAAQLGAALAPLAMGALYDVHYYLPYFLAGAVMVGSGLLVAVVIAPRDAAAAAAVAKAAAAGTSYELVNVPPAGDDDQDEKSANHHDDDVTGTANDDNDNDVDADAGTALVTIAEVNGA